MKFFAVIDTNIIVSALLRKNSVPDEILKAVFNGIITPLVNKKILAEYKEVLSRSKFDFLKIDIKSVMNNFKKYGIQIDDDKSKITEILPDVKDVPFYSVVIASRNERESFLVTGNIKHFPEKYFIVTPRQMLDKIEGIA